MNIELKKKKEQRHYVIRMLSYAVLMIFCYIFVSTVRTGFALPVLLIPCAVCFAVREEPFSSAVFGMVCGLLLDSSSGTLMGFNGILLMWMCMMISLLFHFIFRRNLLNFIWLDCVAVVIQSLLHYLFFYWLWGYDESGLVFGKIFIPEMILTSLGGILLYYMTGVLSKRFGLVTEHYIEEKSEDIVRE